MFRFILLAILSVTQAMSISTIRIMNDASTIRIEPPRTKVPNNWLNMGPSNPDQVVSWYVWFPQNDVEGLTEVANHISDPDSEDYGNYWSREKILNWLSPYESVEPYLNVLWDYWYEHRDVSDIHGVSCDFLGDTLFCNAKVKSVNSIFNTSMYEFINLETNQRHHSTWEKGVWIPEKAKPIVERIYGLSDFPDFRDKETHKKQTNSGNWISNYGIRKMYNITDTHGIPDKGVKPTTQAVLEFQGDECYSASDLNSFIALNDLPDDTKINTIGCDNTTYNPDMEATLDIQFQLAVNPYADTLMITVNLWLYQAAVDLFNMDSPPLVNSMSWGWAEWDQCDPNVFPQCAIPGSAESYVKRVNIEFMKLALRGVTMLASSGDAGAPSRTNEGCMTDNTTHSVNPVFPTSSPWVTSVGGTFVEAPTLAKNSTSLPPACQQNQCIIGGSEKVCNFNDVGWTSGGGSSNFFERPWWQVNASNSYWNSGADHPRQGTYNPSGRLYPDVTLVAHNYMIFIYGSVQSVDGTSASSPTFSAFVSRWNQIRMNNGKPPLGCLGPFLYKMNENCNDCFLDIVDGSNNSTEETSCGKDYGYGAARGYDPVYGLGLPNFDKIVEYIETM